MQVIANKTTWLIVATIAFVGGIEALGQEKKPSASAKPRSTTKVRTGKSSSRDRQHIASSGSVRHYQSQGATKRAPSATAGASARRATPGDRRGVSVKQPTVSTRSRHVASSGSVSRYRPAAVQLPSRTVVSTRDIRVRRVPRYGTTITQLPARHRVISHHGRRYYFDDGICYRSYGGVYRVVRPPIGVRVTWLPEGYVSVNFGGRLYFRFGNTYYLRDIIDGEESYVVTLPPRDAILDQLPPDCQEVQYRGRLYYVDIYEEVAYEAAIIAGRVVYRATDLDVDVDFDDGRIEIEIDD